MKKQALAGTLGFIMMGAAVIPVSAAQGTQSMTVEYAEPSTYIVNVPASVTLNKDNPVNETITASNVNIEPNKSVKVTVTGGIDNSGAVELARAGDLSTKVKSIISLGDTPINMSTAVAEFSGTKDTPDVGGTLSFSKIMPVSGTGVKAGSYNGTITFTISALENK